MNNDSYTLEVSPEAEFRSNLSSTFTTPAFHIVAGRVIYGLRVRSGIDPATIVIKARSTLLPDIYDEMSLVGARGTIKTSASSSYASRYGSGISAESSDSSGTDGEFLPLNSKLYDSRVAYFFPQQSIAHDSFARARAFPGRIRLQCGARIADPDPYFPVTGGFLARGDATTVQGSAKVVTEYSGLRFQGEPRGASIPVSLRLNLDIGGDISGVCPTNDFNTFPGTLARYDVNRSAEVKLEMDVVLYDGQGRQVASSAGSLRYFWEPRQPRKYARTGILSTWEDREIQKDLVLNLGNLTLDAPYKLRIGLNGHSSVVYSRSFDYGRATMPGEVVLSFAPSTTGVFALPKGVTINAPNANIVNNKFVPRERP